MQLRACLRRWRCDKQQARAAVTLRAARSGDTVFVKNYSTAQPKWVGRCVREAVDLSCTTWNWHRAWSAGV
ncbi:hypothetical protein EVAR_7163_1 [Eumeta japonica]|uniref:Uncharacterized protein n=1 Tax=Eumeta variegata TaxID=151549 RepID=A0A4C1U6N0_EUMVA|nr:hypothetical protein EVAR_7163_1 [Eumeta japonica]